MGGMGRPYGNRRLNKLISGMCKRHVARSGKGIAQKSTPYTPILSM